MPTLSLVFTRATQENSPECSSASARLEPLWFPSGWLPPELWGGHCKNSKKKILNIKNSCIFKDLNRSTVPWTLGAPRYLINQWWILSFQLCLKNTDAPLWSWGLIWRWRHQECPEKPLGWVSLLPSNWERTGAPPAPGASCPWLIKCVDHSQYSLE